MMCLYLDAFPVWRANTWYEGVPTLIISLTACGEGHAKPDDWDAIVPGSNLVSGSDPVSFQRRNATTRSVELVLPIYPR